MNSSFTASFIMDRLLKELDLVELYFSNVLLLNPPRVELLGEMLDRLKMLKDQIPSDQLEWVKHWNLTFTKLQQKYICILEESQLPPESPSTQPQSLCSVSPILSSSSVVESIIPNKTNQTGAVEEISKLNKMQKDVHNVKDKYADIVNFVRQHFSSSNNSNSSTVYLNTILQYLAVANSVFHSINNINIDHELYNSYSSIHKHLNSKDSLSFIQDAPIRQRMRAEHAHSNDHLSNLTQNLLPCNNKSTTSFPNSFSTSRELEKCKIRSMMSNEFRQIRNVQSDTDLIGLNKLVIKLAKAIKMCIPYTTLADGPLRCDLFGCAMDKLPEVMRQCYLEQTGEKNDSLGLLRRFLMGLITSAIKMDRSLNQFKQLKTGVGPWLCETCKSNEHFPIKCEIRLKLLCFRCYQLGHLISQCRNKPYLKK